MNYRILKDGEVVNTIVADQSFVDGYCKKHGLTFELIAEPEIEIIPEPTLDERVTELEDALAESDAVAMSLYENFVAQEAINTEQDEAILGLYELMGG